MFSKDHSVLAEVRHKQKYVEEFKYWRFLISQISFQFSNYKLQQNTV